MSVGIINVGKQENMEDKLNKIFETYPNNVCLAMTHDKKPLKRDLKEWEKVFGGSPQYNPVVVQWSKKGKGFGEITFYAEGRKIKCDSERMSKDFVKQVLCQMVDKAEFI